MTDSNRTQLAYTQEASLGVTPAIAATQPMRICRVTGESLSYSINTIRSNELRADRQLPDLVQSGASNGGDAQFELSYPEVRSFLGDMFAAVLFSTWLTTPEAANWATADSNITDAGTTANTYAVASGGALFLGNASGGHLVRASGFTNSANNQLFQVASSTATTVVGTGLGLTAEVAPPIGARLKVVGWRGVTADLSMSTTGLFAGGVINLVSATLDWTTVVRVGQVIKISGFSTGANNMWARIVGIGGTSNRSLALADVSTTGYATESGTGKVISVWFGDVLRNGTTRSSFTLEKGFMAQATPNYAVYKGMVPGQMSLNWQAGQIVTGSFSFLGTTASISTTALATTQPNLMPATPYDVVNAVNNVGRISEAGVTVAASAGLVQSIALQINNNLREQMALGTLGLIGVGVGYFEASGTLRAYFADATYYNKYLANTRTSLQIRVSEATARALVMTMPVVEYTSGQILASGTNQDVMCELGFSAILDTVTGCMVQFDRIDEWV